MGLDMDFVEIWNDVYNTYCGQGHTAMWDYLEDRVASGDLHIADADVMAEDVINTYNL